MLQPAQSVLGVRQSLWLMPEGLHHKVVGIQIAEEHSAFLFETATWLATDTRLWSRVHCQAEA